MKQLALALSLVFLSFSPNSFALDIQGNWQTGCLKGEQAYERETFTASGNQARWFMETSRGSDCKSMMDVEISGSFQIGPVNQINQEANDFDLILSSIKLTPKSGQVAMYLNMTSFCGFSDWAANKTKEVQGLTCGDKQIPKAGDSSYDLVTVKDGILMRGKFTPEHDGSTLEKRPVTLDAERAYTKK